VKISRFTIYELRFTNEDLRILRVRRATRFPYHGQSQRDCVLQPRVARHALPWVTVSNFSPTPTGLRHSHAAPPQLLVPFNGSAGKNRLNSSDAAAWVLGQVMLPDTKHTPAMLAQRPCNKTIPGDVGGEFLFPEWAVANR
jgi:hypothetical protein